MKRPLVTAAVLSTVVTARVAAADQPAGHLVELSLEELLGTPVTTASKLTESVDLAPSTLYVVTEDQIQRLGLRDLKDVLTIVPGVDTVDPHFFLEGGQRGHIGNFSQSLLLINGREINNLIAGETFISNQFRSRNVKQIEIVNGPGSALYGANAVAGVINIITKTPAELDGAELAFSRGSFGTNELGLSFARRAGRTSVAGTLSLYQSDGESFADFLSDTGRASPLAESNPYRRLPNRFGYRNDATAIPVSLFVERSGLYAGTEYSLNQTGRGTSGIQWDYTQGEDHRELGLAYAGFRKEKLRGERLDVKLEYRGYWEKFWGNHTETEGPLVDPRTGDLASFGATDAQVEANRGFYSNKRSDGSRKQVVNLESTYRFTSSHTIVAGLNLERAEVVAARFSRTEGIHPRLTPSETRPEFTNDKLGVYLQDRAKLLDERLIVTLGGRFEHLERSGDTLNPRVGMVYQPVKRSTLKLLYGEAFREPNVFEISHGDRDLRPLKSRALEIGWHQYFGEHLKNDAVVFRNWTSDVIVAVCATEPPPPCFHNQGRSDAHGFEDVLSFKAASLSGFLNYTYTAASSDEADPGKRAAFGASHDVFDIPAHKANLAVLYDFRDRYSFGLLARYRSAVDTEYHGRLFGVARFVACDVTLGIRKLPGLDGARLDLIAKNLFDERYYHPEPRAPSVVEHPQEGRSLSVKLTLRI